MVAYRRDAQHRASAQAHLDEVIHAAGGQVNDRAQIGEIACHALLGEGWSNIAGSSAAYWPASAMPSSI